MAYVWSTAIRNKTVLLLLAKVEWTNTNGVRWVGRRVDPFPGEVSIYNPPLRSFRIDLEPRYREKKKTS